MLDVIYKKSRKEVFQKIIARVSTAFYWSIIMSSNQPAKSNLPNNFQTTSTNNNNNSKRNNTTQATSTNSKACHQYNANFQLPTPTFYTKYNLQQQQQQQQQTYVSLMYDLYHRSLFERLVLPAAAVAASVAATSIGAQQNQLSNTGYQQQQKQQQVLLSGCVLRKNKRKRKRKRKRSRKSAARANIITTTSEKAQTQGAS